MTTEQRTEIKKREEASRDILCTNLTNDAKEQMKADIAALLAEVERLNSELIKAERDRWIADYPGRPEGHSSFWRTVVLSPQWKRWEDKMMQNWSEYGEDKSKADFWDVDGCRECGFISEAHFQSFLNFIRTEQPPTL